MAGDPKRRVRVVRVKGNPVGNQRRHLAMLGKLWAILEFSNLFFFRIIFFEGKVVQIRTIC